MGLGNGYPKSGDKGSNFDYEYHVLKGLDDIATKLETACGFEGTIYKYVCANGTPLENGNALKQAYAEVPNPSNSNFRNKVILGPGDYSMNGSPLNLNKAIDIVGLTSEPDARLTAYDIKYDTTVYGTVTPDGDFTTITDLYNINGIYLMVTVNSGDIIYYGNFYNLNGSSPYPSLIKVSPSGVVTPLMYSNVLSSYFNNTIYHNNGTEEYIIFNSGGVISSYNITTGVYIPVIIQSSGYMVEVIVDNIQPNTCYVRGYFNDVTGSNGLVASKYLAKFNLNGTVDTTFAANIGTSFNNTPDKFVVGNNTIYCMGYFNSFNGNPIVPGIYAISTSGLVTGVAAACNAGFGTNVGGYAMPGLAYMPNEDQLLVYFNSWGGANTFNGNLFTTGIIKLKASNGQYLGQVIDPSYYVFPFNVGYSPTSSYIFLQLGSGNTYLGDTYAASLLPYNNSTDTVDNNYFNDIVGIPSAAQYMYPLFDPNSNLILTSYYANFQNDDPVFILGNPAFTLKGLKFANLNYNGYVTTKLIKNCDIYVIKGTGFMDSQNLPCTIYNSTINTIIGGVVGVYDNSTISNFTIGAVSDVNYNAIIKDSFVFNLYSSISNVVNSIFINDLSIENSTVNNILPPYYYSQSKAIYRAIITNSTVNGNVLSNVSLYDRCILNNVKGNISTSFMFISDPNNQYIYPNIIQATNCVFDGYQSFIFTYQNNINFGTRVIIKDCQLPQYSLIFNYSAVQFSGNASLTCDSVVIDGNGFNTSITNCKPYILNNLNPFRFRYTNCIAKQGNSFSFLSSELDGIGASFGVYENCTSGSWSFNGTNTSPGALYAYTLHRGSFINCSIMEADNNMNFKITPERRIYDSLTGCSVRSLASSGEVFVNPTLNGGNGNIVNCLTVDNIGAIFNSNY